MSDFNPANFLTIAANTPAALRKADVFRLVDSAPPAHAETMAAYITAQRPDLAGEVAECLADVLADRA